MNNISVIVTAFNSSGTVRDCVESILAQTVKDFELILVDDGSTDDTFSIFQEFAKKDKRIIVLKNNKNLNPAFSRNKAILTSKSPLVAITDSDCIVKINWLEEILEELQVHEVIVGSSLSTKKNHWAKAISREYQEWVDFKRRGDYFLGFDTRNCAFKKKVIEKVGFFDPHFKTSQDSEFGVRVLKMGYKIKYANKAIVYHQDPTTLISQYGWAKKRAVSHFLMTKKHNLMLSRRRVRETYFFLTALFIAVFIFPLNFTFKIENLSFFLITFSTFFLLLSFGTFLRKLFNFLMGKKSVFQIIVVFIRDIGFKAGYLKETLFKNY